MGYYTTVHNEISFEPALTEAEAEEFEAFLEEKDIFEFTLEDLNILVPYDDSFKAYCFDENLQIAIDKLGDRKFSGYFEGHGEESGDMWRVRVKDGKVEHVAGVVTWPKGW